MRPNAKKLEEETNKFDRMISQAVTFPDEVFRQEGKVVAEHVLAKLLSNSEYQSNEAYVGVIRDIVMNRIHNISKALMDSRVPEIFPPPHCAIANYLFGHAIEFPVPYTGITPQSLLAHAPSADEYALAKRFVDSYNLYRRVQGMYVTHEHQYMDQDK